VREGGREKKRYLHRSGGGVLVLISVAGRTTYDSHGKAGVDQDQALGWKLEGA
jgi:hypothetical protein